jgi:hypothetical protein
MKSSWTRRKAIGEAGSMMYMESGIGMTRCLATARRSRAAFGVDGRGQAAGDGESLFTTVWLTTPMGQAQAGLYASLPGQILPMDLSQLGGTLICQKDAFCAGARREPAFHVVGFGGEGFIMQNSDGNVAGLLPRGRHGDAAPVGPWRNADGGHGCGWLTRRIEMTSSTWVRSKPHCSAVKACLAKMTPGHLAAEPGLFRLAQPMAGGRKSAVRNGVACLAAIPWRHDARRLLAVDE